MSEPAPDTALNEQRRKQLENQLGLVVSSRIGQNQVTWSIFGIFWAAQVLLVGVLVRSEEASPHTVGARVALLGVVMSIAWGFAQHRSLLHLKRFEDLTKRLEHELAIGEAFQLTMAQRFPGVRARTVIYVCCWGAAVAWLMSFIASFIFCGRGGPCFG